MYGHEYGRPKVRGQLPNDRFQSFHTSGGATDGNDISCGHVAAISEDGEFARSRRPSSGLGENCAAGENYRT